MNLRNDLERARLSFVLTTELHLTFLCVPVTEALNVDWMRFCNMMGGLHVSDSLVQDCFVPASTLLTTVSCAFHSHVKAPMPHLS